ncbi:hypothetical protein GCM10009799_46780 [Nocardiopsis rhodophaea]|uniref:Uncharacterized protein n=1 Tax=Nocardiopsis rhodophaea TaxID=280238 RepID=A0ABP5F3R4_9ACTN
MRFKLILGLTLIAAGAVLALFFWDFEYRWFQGGPLGLLLILLGVLDLGDEYRRSKGHRPRTLLDDIRDDFGGGKSRNNGDQDEGRR